MVSYERYQFIKVQKEDRVATIILNRPESLNIVDAALHVELENVFHDISVDREVNAVVLTGAGKAFCAGGDIRAFAAYLKDKSLPMVTLESAKNLIWNILSVEQPLIAAVNGDAIGVGATLALFCDIIMVSEKARIGDPHVRVGVVAGDGGAVIWPLLIGPARAKEMLLTGDLLSAAQAEKMGLVNRVVPPDELIPAAMALARRLAHGPTLAIRYTKESVNQWLRQQVNLVLETSLGLEFLTFKSHDHEEAVNSFLEKRPPHFTGE